MLPLTILLSLSLSLGTGETLPSRMHTRATRGCHFGLRWLHRQFLRRRRLRPLQEPPDLRGLHETVRYAHTDVNDVREERFLLPLPCGICSLPPPRGTCSCKSHMHAMPCRGRSSKMPAPLGLAPAIAPPARLSSAPWLQGTPAHPSSPLGIAAWASGLD
jgi:hypothetical protein